MRKGMWVIFEGAAAIVVELRADRAFIHTVNPDTGDTEAEIVVPVSQLRQATLAEIPACRRPAADKGAPLGYV